MARKTNHGTVRSMFLFFVLMAVGFFFLFSSMTQVNAAQKVVLKLASEYNDKHPTVRNAWMPWIQELKKKSNGGLIIQFFNPNTLVPAKQVYDAVTSGSVDIGATPTWRSFGKFPLDDVISLPMLFNGAEAGSLTIWGLHQTFPEWRQQYKDVKVLWQWTSATHQIHTKNKQIKTLEDLKGLKIIGWGAVGLRIIKALGANPVQITPPDTYLALERGMADGVLCPLAPMRSFKISDAAKYHTIVDMYCDAFWAGMNWKKWNSLPDEYKKILEETTGRIMAQKSGKTLDEGAIQDAKWMKRHGHKFYVLPAQERKRWKLKAKPLVDAWIADMESKGFSNAREIVKKTMELADEYSAKTVGGYKE